MYPVYPDLSKWLKDAKSLDSLKEDPRYEPRVTLTYNGDTVLDILSSGIKYNRDKFPNDSYKEGAKKVHQALKSFAHWMKNEGSIIFELRAWGDNPSRKITITKDSIDHNYDIDTWHWWLLNGVSELIKEKGL